MELKNEANEEFKEEKQGDKLKFFSTVKTAIILCVLFFFGFGIGRDIGKYFYTYKYTPYIREKEALKQAQKYEEYFKEIHKNDNIGGGTPEETMDLFIKALQEGDYDLASKYFVAEEQEKWLKKFQELNKEQLDNWFGKIEENKKNWRKEQQGENQFMFKYNTGVGDSEVTHFIVLEKISTNKWKIGSF